MNNIKVLVIAEVSFIISSFLTILCFYFFLNPYSFLAPLVIIIITLILMRRKTMLWIEKILRSDKRCVKKKSIKE